MELPPKKVPKWLPAMYSEIHRHKGRKTWVIITNSIDTINKLINQLQLYCQILNYTSTKKHFSKKKQLKLQTINYTILL